MQKKMVFVIFLGLIAISIRLWTQQAPLPEYYGVYVVDNGNLSEIGSPQKIGMAMDSMRKGTELASSGKNFNDPNLYFIFYQKDPFGMSGELVINKLRIVRRYLRWELSQSYNNPPQIRELNKWLVTSEKIMLRKKPVENKQDMIILKPDKPFPPGAYSLSAGSDEEEYYVFSVNIDNYDRDKEALDRITEPGWDGWMKDTYVPYGKYAGGNIRRTGSTSKGDTKEITKVDIHILQIDGMKLIEQSQYQEASNKFLQAIGLRDYGTRSDLAKSHYGLGLSLAYLHKFEEAVKEIDVAINIQPDLTDAYYSMASIYALTNEIDSALKFLEKAISQGFKDYNRIKSDADLDNIREDTRYIKLIEGKYDNIMS